MKINDAAVRKMASRRWKAEKCVPLKMAKYILALVAGGMALVPVILWIAGR